MQAASSVDELSVSAIQLLILVKFMSSRFARKEHVETINRYCLGQNVYSSFLTIVNTLKLSNKYDLSYLIFNSKIIESPFRLVN